MSFQADSRISEQAQTLAAKAVAFAKQVFQVDLDWSEESIAKLEAILDRMHRDRTRRQISDGQTAGFGEMLGSYIGEVFRRHHTAQWGMVDVNGQKIEGMKLEPSGVECWPWGRVYHRIAKGEQENVQHYYQGMIEQARQT